MPLIARGWAAGLMAVAVSGLVLVVVAWARAEDTVAVDDQMWAAALGLAGATAIGLCAVSALTLVRGAVRRRLRSVSSVLEARLAGLRSPEPATAGAAAEDRVAAARMRHYHRPGCAMVAGKPTSSATAAVHRAAGLRSCGVCSA